MYPPIRLPLREQHAAITWSGMQEPWVLPATAVETADSSGGQLGNLRAPTPLLPVSVNWQVSSSASDPFNSLPIDMPLKSRELFHYCE